MHILFIDLASNIQSLALVTPEKTIAIKTAEARFDENQLMPIIESMLSDHRLRLQDIDRIACVTGPGGFMSLRVGVSLANALSYSLDIPIAAIHLSDLWAARIFNFQFLAPRSLGVVGSILNSFVWLHSTKRTHLFIRGFGSFAKQWPEAALIANADLASIEAKTPIVGELIEEHATLISHCKHMMNLGSVEQILPGFLDGLKYDKKQLMPWYGREA